MPWIQNSILQPSIVQRHFKSVTLQNHDIIDVFSITNSHDARFQDGSQIVLKFQNVALRSAVKFSAFNTKLACR